MATAPAHPKETEQPKSHEHRNLTPKTPPRWNDDPPYYTSAQRKVYQDLVELINQPTSIVDALYDAIPDSFGGKVIGTDAARELSDPYRLGGFEGALLYSPVTSGPASAYAQDRFRREIVKAPIAKKRRVLVMTAGGPASGKTSVVRGGLLDGTVDLVMDQNLGKHARAVEQIELALTHDWEVQVVYVFKLLDLVATKVVDRANHIGRWSYPLTAAVQAHRTAQESVVKLYDKYRESLHVQVQLMVNLHSKQNPVSCTEMSIQDIRPGGKYFLGEDQTDEMADFITKALQTAKASGTFDPRLIAAMEFGTNPATLCIPPPPQPPVYVMSKYHPTTHSTDRDLTPPGVLKLSSGDCRDLMDPSSSKCHTLLKQIRKAQFCKVTWGTTLARRKEHIREVLTQHPDIEKDKVYCATPYEEAHATAVSCPMHDDVEGVVILVAFGGSCLHVLSVNQDGRTLLPGSNPVSKGLSASTRNALMKDNVDLIGTSNDWIPVCPPPLPPDKDTFYTTFPLDQDLSLDQYLSLARLFEELNALMVSTAGGSGSSYLVCGAPTNINPDGQWWPDRSPRAVQTTFLDLARHSAQPQVPDPVTRMNHGGLLSDRHGVTLKDTGRRTTVHEMVLSAMAAPQLAIAAIESDELPGLGKAIEHFK